MDVQTSSGTTDRSLIIADEFFLVHELDGSAFNSACTCLCEIIY